MTQPLQLLNTLVDLLTVALGFGLIIFVHELGHFLAAKWAGIRTLAFAVGFGPAVLSYRKGMGLRRGSSAAEYQELAKSGAIPTGMGTTEYRLNALPLGGYVKMLGQEDLNPEATSAAADSYQMCKPWKRMVVISAGVIMNLITAAILFVVVFLIGLRTEPPIAGSIAADAPAASAEVLNAEEAGIDPADTGVKPGDEILLIRGERPRTYNDVALAIMMAPPNQPVDLTVRREGVETPLELRATPEIDENIRLLRLGIGVPRSTTLFGFDGNDAGDVTRALENAGLPADAEGAKVTAAAGTPVSSPADLTAAFAASEGRPVVVDLTTPAGESLAVTLEPEAELMVATTKVGDSNRLFEHVLGLVPLMRVDTVQPRASQQGLRVGDVFARVGPVEFPSNSDAIREIQSAAGGTIQTVVIRDAADGSEPTRVSLTFSVDRAGTIGFTPGTTAETDAIVALPPDSIRPLLAADDDAAVPAPAGDVITRPGTRIAAVNGEPTVSLIDVRNALIRAHADATTDTDLTVVLSLENQLGQAFETEWIIPADDAAALAGLGWLSPIPEGLFETQQFVSKEAGPVAAVGRGLHETKRLALQTYLTFARLFQGSVRVEHLKGPVGIAHVGTLIADRGFVWLLFFFAMISVNLAVINFLPLPIVDGGQFLMLVYEQIRGRPIPIPVQNAVTLAGLALIGTVFLIVTFNDIRSLLSL